MGLFASRFMRLKARAETRRYGVVPARRMASRPLLWAFADFPGAGLAYGRIAPLGPRKPLGKPDMGRRDARETRILPLAAFDLLRRSVPAPRGGLPVRTADMDHGGLLPKPT